MHLKTEIKDNSVVKFIITILLFFVSITYCKKREKNSDFIGQKGLISNDNIPPLALNSLNINRMSVLSLATKKNNQK